jgi:hypothetical protein
MRWVAIGRLTPRIVTLSCVAVVFAGLMIAGCGSGSVRLTSERTTVAVPASPVPASAIPRLRAIADRAAKENGGAVPSWISAVVTTQEKALTSATPGAVVPAGGKTVVYLVTMKGHFKFERGPRLLAEPRTRAPALNYQFLVVSAETLEVTASGLSPKPPPVAPSSLGPVTWLKREAQRGGAPAAQREDERR